MSAKDFSSSECSFHYIDLICIMADLIAFLFLHFVVKSAPKKGTKRSVSSNGFGVGGLARFFNFRKSKRKFHHQPFDGEMPVPL